MLMLTWDRKRLRDLTVRTPGRDEDGGEKGDTRDDGTAPAFGGGALEGKASTMATMAS